MKKLTIRLLTSIFIALTLSLIALAGQNPLPVNAADSQSECWAVIAGVADYKFSNIDDLIYSDDNVLDFSRELSPVWGDSHVKSLIDSQATKAGILDAINWLAANADANDTVLFYFSGHGGSEGYFCPYDYNGYTFSTTISPSELANSFRAVGAGKIVIILDICHAGTFQEYLTKNGRVVLMATGANELGWQVTYLQHFAYTYYLLEAFEEFDEADVNHDYELSAEEIARYAGPLTSQYEETYDFESIQHPVLDDRYSGELALLAKFVFAINTSLPSGTRVLTLDDTTYTSAPAPMIWIPGSTHTMTVPKLVEKGSGTRYVFTSWNDGIMEVSRTFMHGSFTANYDTEFLLKIISEYGDPQGAGWYKDGTTATFSVTPYIELPDTKHYFTDWSGAYTGDIPSASITINAPSTVKANWRHEYLLTVSSEYGNPQGAGWYREGEKADFSVTPYIEEPDKKHYFTGWSGAYTGDMPSASTTMNTPGAVTASWRHEYLLTVNSEYGVPTGGGWYKEDETAAVSVTPVQGIIIRHIFTGWSGDLTAAEAEAATTMNAPKVIGANWRTDYVQLFILAGGAIVVVAVVVILIVRATKRRNAI